MKLNCGAKRYHYSMFNVGSSMFDVHLETNPAWHEYSLSTDMVFDMIPNVGILKAWWTAQSDLMPANINKSQEQT
jgi:hypothetical protein